MGWLPEKARKARQITLSQVNNLLNSSKMESEDEPATKATWKHLFVFTSRDDLSSLPVAIVATMISSGIRTFQAVAFGRIFDIMAAFGAGRMDGPDALRSVSTWSLVLMGMGIGTWISHTVFMSMWMVFGEAQARSARREMFSSLLSKDMAWYDGQPDGTPSLLTRIETQTHELQLGTSQPFGLILHELLLAVGSVILALYSSWELTLVLFASLPISYAVMSLVSKPLEPAIQAQKKCLAGASKLATASLIGIDLVKVFNGFDSEMWQYLAVMKKVTAKYLIQARCNALQLGYVEFWLIAMFAAGFWYGARLVDKGLSPGAVFTTFCAIFAAFQGVDAIVPQFMVLSKGMAAGNFLRELAPKPEKGGRPKDGQTMYQPGKCVGDVDLTDVSFAYPSNPSKVVLENSSFSFAAGELTFLVGKSGSGKSTISNLVLGFYETLTGEVRIDGYRLGCLDPAWIRSNITLIQQSSILFDDTFFQNVAFGLRDPGKASIEDVKNACDAALLQSTIASLPNGMETMVGSGGYSLSGGQKQRLALARARLRDPPVLVLDEVTSGLDHMSRTLVMEAIREWRKGKTTIIITHDVAQIEDADYVYVLDKGKVVQEGYRGHLICDEDALFASLVKSATDEEPESGSDYGDGTLEPTSVEQSTVTAPPRRGASSFFGTFGEGLFTLQSGIPKGTSLGGQFALATRMRQSQFWEAGAHENDHGADVGTCRRQLPRQGLMNHTSEMGAGATAENGRRDESSPWGSMDLGFDFVEQVGISAQASRLSGSQSRQRQRRSGVDSIATADEEGGPLDTTKFVPSNLKDKYGGNTSISTILRTVWPNLSVKQRIIFILGLLSCLVASAAVPVFSYLLARLLSAFWAPTDRLSAGQKWAIILLGVAVVDGLSNFLSRYLMEYTGQSWINTLRIEAFQRILRQPKEWFDTSGNTVGKINECLDRNAEEMRNLVGRFLPSVLIVVAMILAALIWALTVSWKLTLVALSPAPLFLASMKGSSYFNGKWQAKCDEGSEAASAISRQTFVNIRVVRTLTLEGYFSQKHEDEAAKVFALGVRRAWYAGFFYGTQEALNMLIAALIFYYGMQMIARRELAVDSILEVMNLLLFSIGAATAIMGTLPQITSARTTAIQMLNYASLPPSPPRETEGGRKAITPFPICFGGLSFAYPSRPNQEVLRNLRLRLDAGTSTAIVGRSGCGKSTLASLLLGLYNPARPSTNGSTASLLHWSSEEKRGTSGYGYPALSFGGIPWDEIDVMHLRSMMSYVPQAPFLFPGTIAANIAYGIAGHHPLAQMHNIEAAARAAGIHSYIETLSEGYNTVVGDGGLTLSGGQAQRVCIARAMARWPRVLVLDEPTSALDAQSAEAVREAIKGLVNAGGERMSVVVVTHCREMMRVMGRVVVLEGGFVAEEGGYEELMGKKGGFARLVKG